MKNILIAGETSYIGKSLKNWLGKEASIYIVDAISLKDESWKDKDFNKYDAVVFTVGIAHRKETEENKDLYYKINRDLTYEAAQKSKQDGVKQFIFLSTMSVYGLEDGIIDKNTPLEPKTFYGKSKLEAEELIKSLEDDNFKIAILRPPMVYGKGCKGNYPRLAKMSKITPIFPNIRNRRSMIFIDNLSEFTKLIIDDCASGLFLPQNRDYVETSDMVTLISKVNGKKMITTKLFNPILHLGIKLLKVFRKVFGTLIYDEELLSMYENDKYDYEVCSFEESIERTEK